MQGNAAMLSKRSLIYKTSLVVGLASFLISNAFANPCEEYVQTDCGYTQTIEHSSGPVTPHSYQGDLTGCASHSGGPEVASRSDTVGDLSPAPIDDSDPCPHEAVYEQCE